MMEFYICSLQSVVTSHMLLSMWNGSSLTQEVDFKFCLTLFYLNVNSHMWLVATVLYTVQK